MLDALEIGYAIKDKRTQLGMTQAQVAKAAGVSERCLWSLELGQNTGVQFDKLTAILSALGMELELKDTADPKVTTTENEIEAPIIPSSVMEKRPGSAKALAILTEGSL